MIIYKFQKLEQLPFPIKYWLLVLLLTKEHALEMKKIWVISVLLHKLIVSVVGQDIVGVDAAVVVVKVELQTEIRTGNSSPGMNLNRLPLEAKKWNPDWTMDIHALFEHNKYWILHFQWFYLDICVN